MGEKQAIKKGKKWMRDSKDPIHDYEHAENVAYHSLEILNSLKENDWSVEPEIDENLILLCAWWHDCYKALFEKHTLINECLEGLKSAKIAQGELKNFVDEERLNEVIKSIKLHNNLPYLLLSGKRMPVLIRILIEADAIEARNCARKRKRKSCCRSSFHKIVVFFVEPVVSFLQNIYIKSPYAKCQLGLMNNKKKQ